MKDLTFDEYELLSDDEKIKYVEEMRSNGKMRPFDDILKDLEELNENLRKDLDSE